MITRRKIVGAIGAGAFAPLGAFAQQPPAKLWRVGSAYLASSASTRPYEDAFLDALRELGFERGRNLIYDVRNADGDPSRLAALIDELLAQKPDLLVGIEQVAQVMRSKTSSTPIVLTTSSDPIAAGLANTLAKPGGNVTGIAALYELLATKHVEILTEFVPKMKSVAILLDPGVPGTVNIERHAREAAATKRLKPLVYRAADRAALAQAFAAMRRDRPDGLVSATGSGIHFGERQFIADSALSLRMPCSGVFAANAEAGSLFSYGASLHGMFRQAATHAARILKGANPANLPIEQPTRFEMVINGKTAKALKLKLPQTALIRAERVIE